VTALCAFQGVIFHFMSITKQFMARLEQVEHLLGQANINEREPARARLTFNGRPVVGSYGIFADFGILPNKRRIFEFKLKGQDEVIVGRVSPAVTNLNEINAHLYQTINIYAMENGR